MTYVGKQKVGRPRVPRNAGLNVFSEGTRTRSSIGLVKLLNEGHRLTDYELVQEVVYEGHLCRSLPACAVYRAVKVSDVDDIELGLPDVGKF